MEGAVAGDYGAAGGYQMKLFVIACDKREAFAQGSVATTCPPKLSERRRKQSILPSPCDGLLQPSLAMTGSVRQRPALPTAPRPR